MSTKRILITGFSGFVATYFVEYLYDNDLKYDIVGIDLKKPDYNYDQLKDKLKISFYEANLLDREKLLDIISEVNPDYVLHLASYSSVAYSWKYPEKSFSNNSNIFLNLVHVVQIVNPQCRVLSVGSSEEYGNVTHENIPIRENQELSPVSPYAVARVAQEMMSKVYANAYDVQIILTRSFNHIGPRQDERFVVPGFIKRVCDIKTSGAKKGIIQTGNLEIIRDFVDVRDVVRAYYILLTKGTVGEIYNICSGKGIKLSQIIDIIAEITDVEITTEVNPDLIRPDDNLEIVGSAYKIYTEFGWKPERKIIDTIKDMVDMEYKRGKG